MNAFPEGNAVVYCQGAFGTTNGKTAHGLVRRSKRYRVLAVVDARHAGDDAGRVLDGAPNEIPIVPDLESAVHAHRSGEHPATHFVLGLAPDGGRLPPSARQDIARAIQLGLHVDSGLHDFLSQDPTMAALAAEHGVVIRDIRKPPDRDTLHFFSGKIEQVTALKVALLGTDSAIGKRTTAWMVVDALEEAGVRAELIGTGQTAWMQGARYSIVIDSLVNDFVAGEIEHAVWSAWQETRPDVIVIEGQGSLMNPAYPGGHEILAAGRPDVVILQHAPARTEYDGFPGYPLHPLPVQIQAVELLSEKRVIAIAVNHEQIPDENVARTCATVARETGLPTCAPLKGGVGCLIDALLPYVRSSVAASGSKEPADRTTS